MLIAMCDLSPGPTCCHEQNEVTLVKSFNLFGLLLLDCKIRKLDNMASKISSS
jgi:hypothetical protein